MSTDNATYTVRLRDGNAWLDVLDEKGDVAQFDTRAAAVIRGKALLEAGQAEEVKVYRNGEQVRMWMGDDGSLHVEGLL